MLKPCLACLLNFAAQSFNVDGVCLIKISRRVLLKGLKKLSFWESPVKIRDVAGTPSEDVYSGNIFEVIKAAYFIDSDNLLNKAVTFLVKNAKTLKETEDWKMFKKSHPDCFIKMMDLIMFSK